jgi:hypothetical protein
VPNKKINNTGKYKMKIKLLVAAAATVVASSAMAQSAFEGAYGQIGIGYQSSKAKFNQAGNSFDSTNGFASAVGLGYNFSVSKDFLLGIGADYSFVPTSEANSTYTNDDGSTGSEKYKNQNTYNIFITPGFVISKDSLAYAKVGYTGTTYKFPSSSQNLTGYSLGLGYKQIIQGGLYGFAEGNYFSYSNKDVGGGNLSGNSMNLLVGVGYKF